MRTYVIRDGLVRKLKDGVNLSEYLVKHPGSYKVHCPPSMNELEEMVSEGIAEAVDGCSVEPDGTCEHGKPSWIMAMGYI